MKDCSKNLRIAYLTALSGISVTVYDRVPNTVSGNYVRIGPFVGLDDSEKTRFGQIVTQDVEVIAKYDADMGGKEETDDIADEIIDIIRTRSQLDLTPTFNIIVTTLDSTSIFEEETEKEYVYRRVIRFRHLIEQLT